MRFLLAFLNSVYLPTLPFKGKPFMLTLINYVNSFLKFSNLIGIRFFKNQVTYKKYKSLKQKNFLIYDGYVYELII